MKFLLTTRLSVLLVLGTTSVAAENALPKSVQELVCQTVVELDLCNGFCPDMNSAGGNGGAIYGCVVQNLQLNETIPYREYCPDHCPTQAEFDELKLAYQGALPAIDALKQQLKSLNKEQKSRMDQIHSYMRENNIKSDMHMEAFCSKLSKRRCKKLSSTSKQKLGIRTCSWRDKTNTCVAKNSVVGVCRAINLNGVRLVKKAKRECVKGSKVRSTQGLPLKKWCRWSRYKDLTDLGDDVEEDTDPADLPKGKCKANKKYRIPRLDQ